MNCGFQGCGIKSNIYPKYALIFSQEIWINAVEKADISKDTQQRGWTKVGDYLKIFHFNSKIDVEHFHPRFQLSVYHTSYFIHYDFSDVLDDDCASLSPMDDSQTYIISIYTASSSSSPCQFDLERGTSTCQSRL